MVPLDLCHHVTAQIVLQKFGSNDLVSYKEGSYGQAIPATTNKLKPLSHKPDKSGYDPCERGWKHGVTLCLL